MLQELKEFYTAAELKDIQYQSHNHEMPYKQQYKNDFYFPVNAV